MNLSATSSLPRRLAAFTLIEVLITTVLLLMLVTSGLYALAQMDHTGRRISEYTSVASIASGALEDIKAQPYNPPLGPFGPKASVTTNMIAIGLSKDGTNYAFSGAVITRIEPVADGHLITVQANFTNWNRPYNVTVQNVVNAFSNPL